MHPEHELALDDVILGPHSLAVLDHWAILLPVSKVREVPHRTLYPARPVLRGDKNVWNLLLQIGYLARLLQQLELLRPTGLLSR